MTSSPAVAERTAEWVRQGWNVDNSRVSRLYDASPHPGFLTDSHLHSEVELKTLASYTDFLIPVGLAAGAATIIQGANDDAVVLAFEGFGSHQQSRDAVAGLNLLRPHLARAVALSSQIEALQTRTLLESFEILGAPVALLDRDAAVVACNDMFREIAENTLNFSGKTMVALEKRSQSRFSEAFAKLIGSGEGSSLALHDAEKKHPVVMHLVRRSPVEQLQFRSIVAFAMLSKPGNASVPRADLIAALFDLTPAEARVARGIAAGLSPQEVALELNISFETARNHLKRVFGKTSVARQNELAALLANMGPLYGIAPRHKPGRLG